jgi:hypothetical protein
MREAGLDGPDHRLGAVARGLLQDDDIGVLGQDPGRGRGYVLVAFVEVELDHTQGRMGDLQGGPDTEELGDDQAAGQDDADETEQRGAAGAGQGAQDHGEQTGRSPDGNEVTEEVRVRTDHAGKRERRAQGAAQPREQGQQPENGGEEIPHGALRAFNRTTRGKWSEPSRGPRRTSTSDQPRPA